MRVLVTGAASPLGAAVCREFGRNGVQVVGVVRPGGTLPSHLIDEVVAYDLATEIGFSKLMGDFEAFVHVASLSEGSPAALMACTGLSTWHLLQRAISLGVRTFVHVSSMSVYGDVLSPLVDHQTPIQHSTPYGAAKWAAECYLASCDDRIKTVSVRAPAIVGQKSHRHFLARVHNAMVNGEPEIQVSNPDFLFNNLIHEDNLADFLVTLSTNPPNSYCAFPVSSSEPMPLREIIGILAASTSFQGDVTWTDSSTLPFSIDSALATQLGLLQRPTKETINWWMSSVRDVGSKVPERFKRPHN